jgi:hypothetical protein
MATKKELQEQIDQLQVMVDGLLDIATYYWDCAHNIYGMPIDNPKIVMKEAVLADLGRYIEDREGGILGMYEGENQWLQ